MQLLLTTLLLLASVAFGKEKAKPEQVPSAIEVLPIQVEYLKTGREDASTAAKLGDAEVENANPCVSKMKRDLEQLVKREEMKEALEAVATTFTKDPKPRPYLILRYMNEAMELRFEMRSPPVKGNDGTLTTPEQVKYRRAVFLSDKAGTWAARMGADQCHVTEERFSALIDELREADRLVSCILRKKELLDASQKITNYIHNYLPVNWIEEARRKLIMQNEPANGLLREDQTAYRVGNGTYRECARGLKLLEEDASASVRVLNEVRESKKGTDVPSSEIEELERKLTNKVKVQQ